MTTLSGYDETRRSTAITFAQVESETPLPEIKKEWTKKAWQRIVDNGDDGLFQDPPELSAADAYKTAPTPLDSVPVPAGDGTNGAVIEQALRERQRLAAENAKKEAYRERLVTDRKAAIGAGLLRAFEPNAVGTAERMRNDAECVLVPEKDGVPAKYDGVAIWKKYQALKGFNDDTRQDYEAENLLHELSIALPENCTPSQFTLLASRFQLKVKDHLLRPMNPKLQVKWLIERMPKSAELIAAKGRIIEKLRDADEDGDWAKALKLIERAIDDAHDPTAAVPDVGAVIVENIAGLKGQRGYFVSSGIVEFLNTAGASFSAIGSSVTAQSLAAAQAQTSSTDTLLSGAAGKGKGAGKGGGKGAGGAGGKGAGKKGLKPLPNGDRCKPDATCNMNHKGWCWDSPFVQGTMPGPLAKDPAWRAQNTATRKANALKLGVPYVPFTEKPENGERVRLHHVKYPGKTCREVIDPSYVKPPGKGASAANLTCDVADDEEDESDEWRRLFAIPGQKFTNGSYVMYEESQGDYRFADSFAEGASGSEEVASPTAPNAKKFYVVCGGSMDGIHCIPKNDYDRVLRPYVDSQYDDLGAVKCESATTRAIAEQAYARIQEARRARMRARPEGEREAPAHFAQCYCVIVGDGDSGRSPLDPSRALVGVHLCERSGDVEAMYRAAGAQAQTRSPVTVKIMAGGSSEAQAAALAEYERMDAERRSEREHVAEQSVRDASAAEPAPGTAQADGATARAQGSATLQPSGAARDAGEASGVSATERRGVSPERTDRSAMASDASATASHGAAAADDGGTRDVAPDWLPPEREPDYAFVLYLAMREWVRRGGAMLGSWLELALGLMIVCGLVCGVTMLLPLSAPASVALVAQNGPAGAVRGIADAYGVSAYLPRVDVPGATGGLRVDLFLVALVAYALTCTVGKQVLVGAVRQSARVCTWIGVAAIRSLVDLDRGLVATRGRWTAVGRRVAAVAQHLLGLLVFYSLLTGMTTFMVAVTPVGATPTHRQLNAMGVMMDKAPLLLPGQGRAALDAFTTAKYEVSVATPPLSFLSGLDTLELCESLGLEASVDLSDAREGGWASNRDVNDPTLALRLDRARAYKNASLNIWDSGCNRGNFTSLKYAKKGTVRANKLQMSTAGGMYTPPKTFDAVVPVRGYRNGKKVIKMVEIPGSFLNESCPHNLLPPGVLAHEQAIGTWIAPSGDQSFIVFPDGTTSTLINMGIVVLPDESTPCEPVTRLPAHAESRAAGENAEARDMDSLSGVTVGDRGFTKSVTAARIRNRFNLRDPRRLIDLPRCTDAPAEWSNMLREYSKNGPPACDASLRGTARGVGSTHHVPDPKVVGGIISFDCYTLSTPHRFGGQRKIIRFRDVKSRGYGRSYLMHSESESAHMMGLFHSWCKSKGVTPLRYHTDNATVFAGSVGDTCRTKAAALGVHFTTISPHVPRQNGLSEHDWSVLGADTRNMLAWGKLPRSLAWYCWQQAEEVAACIPFRDNPDQCQYSVFHGGVKPHVAKYRPPGCMCYVKVIRPNPNKEQEQAVRAIHLCRARDQPGYCVLDPSTGRIYVTPHVRFVEDEAPGITVTPGGSERVVPSFADDYDSRARQAEGDLPEDWYPVQPVPGTDLGGSPSDAASPEEAQRDQRPMTAAERRAASAPPPGERIADRRPVRAVRANNATDKSPGGTVLFEAGMDPAVPFVLILGSGTRRAGDMGAQVNPATQLAVLVDVKLGGAAHDLTSENTTRALCALAAHPRCVATYSAFPCKTWCAARRLRPGPPLLRIDLPGQRWPMGLPANQLTPYWHSLVTEHNLIVSNGVRVLQACWEAGGAAAAECPVDRSKERALDPRHVIEGCEGHVSQFTHPAFVDFRLTTGAAVVWGDQCALEWRPFPSAPLPAQKTTQWMVTPTLCEAARAGIGALRCMPHHNHGGQNSLVGGVMSGAFRTAGTEQYSPPLCRMLIDLLFSHERGCGGGPAGADEEDSDGEARDAEPGEGTRVDRDGEDPVKQAPASPGLPSPNQVKTRAMTRGEHAHEAAESTAGTKHHDICLYVDDGFATADVGCAAADKDMAILDERFKLTRQPDIDLFVGMNMKTNSDGSVELSSEAYISSLVDKYLPKPLESYPKAATPAAEELRRAYERALEARAGDNPPPIDASLQKEYASLVGAMIYAVPGVRIAEAQAVAMLARALTFPTRELMTCAVRVLVHMGRTKGDGIRYSADAPNASELVVYTDSDWDTRNGTTGTVHLLAGAAIAHNSKKQPCVSMSSTEAEIIAASQGALEAVYFRRLLNEMQVPQYHPTKVYVDNQGAIELSKHQKSCHRSRHVLRRYFKVRELQAQGEIEVLYCPTDQNWADFLTKVVSPAKWAACKAATSGRGSGGAAAEHADSPLDVWALALDVPPHIATYAEYVAAFGDPAECAGCASAGRPHADPSRSGSDASTSIRRGAAGDFASFSSASTCFDCNESESSADGIAASAAASHEYLAVQANSMSSVRDPAVHGLYETGIDDNWMAFPVTTASDNPSYDAAQNSGDKPKWDDAMHEEIENLKRFKAFDEVPESSVPGWSWVTRVARLVTECIWVLRRKRDANNEIAKYKARCVFNDKRRVNRALIETFSPAVRHTTVKASIAASVLRNRRRFAFDVTGAYLQGEYTEGEDVWARPPRGYRTLHDDGSPIVWKMRVPLYGQGDAGLVWFRTMRKQLVEVQGFNQSDADPSYFWKRT